MFVLPTISSTLQFRLDRTIGGWDGAGEASWRCAFGRSRVVYFFSSNSLPTVVDDEDDNEFSSSTQRS